MKATKKLTALFLALAMALSLCVCASAEDKTLPSQAYSANGTVKKESAPNSTVYKLTFPTDMGETFNFILDPENLIRNTHAAAYSGNTFTDVAGHLFFKNKTTVNDSVIESYSGTSDALTVTNKSNVPVKVTMTASLEKMTGVKFVATEADLASEATDPAIYLAVQSECKDTANAPWDYTLPEVVYVNDDYIGIIQSAVFAWDDSITAAIAAEDPDDADKVAAAKAANKLKDDFNTALGDDGLKIEFDYVHMADANDDGEDDTAVMTATPKAVSLGDYVFAFDDNNVGYLLDSEATDGDATNPQPTAVLTANLTVTKPDDESTPDVNESAAIGAFTFNFKSGLKADKTGISAYLEDATVSVSVSAGSKVMDETTAVVKAQAEGEGEGEAAAAAAADDGAVEAKVERLLPGVPNAYKLSYENNAYAYVEQVEQGSPNVYKALSFKLTGKINDAADWKGLGTPTIAVTWNIEGTVDEEGNNSPPTLTVTTAVQGTTGNGVWEIAVNNSGMTKVASAKTSTKPLTPTAVTAASYAAPKANYIYDAEAKTITVYVKANASTAPQASYKSTTIVLANADESTKYTLTFDATAVTTEAIDFTLVTE